MLRPKYLNSNSCCISFFHQKEGKSNVRSCFVAPKRLSCTYCTKTRMQRESFTLEPRVAAHHKATGELQAYYETTDQNAVAFRWKHQINLNLPGCTRQHH